MKCFRYFFLSFLFVGFLSFLFVKNVSALSVTCVLDPTLINHNSLPSSCDVSSFDSDKIWSYTLSFDNFSIPSTTSGSAVATSFSLSCGASSSQVPFFSLPRNNFFSSFSDSFIIFDRLNFRLSSGVCSHYSHYSWAAASLSSNYSGSISLTISDSYFDSSCPPVEPCPVIPENPYDTKLDNITMAIYTCAAIFLVLYFFYCIYRMIIKNSGVR